MHSVRQAAFTLKLVQVQTTGIHVRVIINTGLLVFQWQLFTLISVLYGVDLGMCKLFLFLDNPYE